MRKLSSAFAAWLAPGAAGTMIVGDTWDRFYNDDVLDTLRHIIVLLKQNRNYAWVRERLTAEFGAGEVVAMSDEAEVLEADPATS